MARRRAPIYALAKAIVPPVIRFWVRLDCQGLLNIPTHGPVIIAANHISYFDPLCLAVCIDAAGREVRFLAKSELFRNPLLGWLLVLGLGGTLVEALGAVTWRSCPIERADAEAMIEDVPALATLLRGARGAPPADRAALVETLVALSRLPQRLGDRLETVDVNPLLVRAERLGAVALDALVVLKPEE